MKIAVIGTGIAGMVSAWSLHHAGHQVSVFEAGSYIGGHTNTVTVQLGGQSYAVDTGFIVFNDWTYPNFIRLMELLGVASQPTTMSFSVHDPRSGLEYNGTSINTLFAQRRNFLRPSFYRMIRDILRFGREAPLLLTGKDDDALLTIDDYVRKNNYSKEFVEHYLLPMGGAIWSAGTSAMRTFPARYFVQFFKNHGMLSVDERPQWRVISNGSASYIKRLTEPFENNIFLNSPVQFIRRDDHGVTVQINNEAQRFDQVIIATHGNQALRLLSDPTPNEQDILSHFSTTRNEAVLHTDITLMPRRRRAWAAWNYRMSTDELAQVPVTYDMNALQGLDAPERFLVTLNPNEPIAPGRILRSITYQHPHYTSQAVAAQKRWSEINGVNRTYYCGAYWGYGFHEDGVVSAMRVATALGAEILTSAEKTAR
jgi:predicted NAD/FAD-binding protein